MYLCASVIKLRRTSVWWVVENMGWTRRAAPNNRAFRERKKKREYLPQTYPPRVCYHNGSNRTTPQKGANSKTCSETWCVQERPAFFRQSTSVTSNGRQAMRGGAHWSTKTPVLPKFSISGRCLFQTKNRNTSAKVEVVRVRYRKIVRKICLHTYNTHFLQH